MSPYVDDDTAPFGEEELVKSGQLVHPYVTFFHMFFRSLALFFYIFSGLTSSGFIASFVFIVLLLSLDFWTVKNISGRLMVGLRWWNIIDDEGKSQWKFESRKGDMQNKVSATEASIFWTSLVVYTLIWGLFFLTALFGFSFKWMLLVWIALTLNFANLYGYVKCKMGGKNFRSFLSPESSVTAISRMVNTFNSLATKNEMPAQPATNVPSPSNIV